jgi:hypothetical protein
VADPGQRTLFRQALQKALHEQLRDESGGKVTVQGGEITGFTAQERDIACVWWAGKRPHRAAILEENVYRVRMFKRFKQDQGGEEPRTDRVEALEKAAEDLEDALAAILTLPWLQTVSGIENVGDHDFFNVLEITTNYQSYYVEAALTAFATNRTSRGG